MSSYLDNLQAKFFGVGNTFAINSTNNINGQNGVPKVTGGGINPFGGVDGNGQGGFVAGNVPGERPAEYGDSGSRADINGMGKFDFTKEFWA